MIREQEIIMEQLGRDRFLIATGSHNLFGFDNTIRMSLRRNISKANKLEITYISDVDLYTMRFYEEIRPGFDNKKLTWQRGGIRLVREINHLQGNQLVETFSRTTGIRVRL